VKVAPGDVLAVRTGGMAASLIRFGAALRGEPNLDNHIAVVHHADRAGTTWCIEGRPGGVGWRDARAYLASPWTVTTAAEPKTGLQRQAVCEALEAAIGTPYDWKGIAADAAQAIHLPDLWQEKWDGQVPGHVVCSSLAAWAYMKAGLAYPVASDLERTTPADWTRMCIIRESLIVKR
jgi:hypothetical protein